MDTAIVVCSLFVCSIDAETGVFVWMHCVSWVGGIDLEEQLGAYTLELTDLGRRVNHELLILVDLAAIAVVMVWVILFVDEYRSPFLCSLFMIFIKDSLPVGHKAFKKLVHCLGVVVKVVFFFIGAWVLAVFDLILVSFTELLNLFLSLDLFGFKVNFAEVVTG